MVVLSILEEKDRSSVTTEFIPRSSSSIFPAPLKLFCSGNSNKGNHPPACAVSFKYLACLFLCAQTSASAISALSGYWIKPSRSPANLSYWSNRRSTFCNHHWRQSVLTIALPPALWLNVTCVPILYQFKNHLSWLATWRSFLTPDVPLLSDPCQLARIWLKSFTKWVLL